MSLRPSAKRNLIAAMARIWGCTTAAILPVGLIPKDKPTPDEWDKECLTSLRELATACQSHGEVIDKLRDLGMARRRQKRNGRGPSGASKLNCVVVADIKAATKFFRDRNERERNRRIENRKRAREEEEVEEEDGSNDGDEDESDSQPPPSKRARSDRDESQLQPRSRSEGRRSRATLVNSNAGVESRQASNEEQEEEEYSGDYMFVSPDQGREKDNRLLNWVQAAPDQYTPGNPNDPRVARGANSMRSSEQMSVHGIENRFSIPAGATQLKKLKLFKLQAAIGHYGLIRTRAKYQIELLKEEGRGSQEEIQEGHLRAPVSNHVLDRTSRREEVENQDNDGQVRSFGSKSGYGSSAS